MSITQKVVWMKGRQGVVVRKRGAHAVEVRVWTEVPEKDFLTGKLTVWKGFRTECWPIRKLEQNEVTT